jgi:outer membrane usher protein
VDTAIAFADTEVAVGRPIRSGFALVDTHPSLKDSELHLAPSPDGDAAISDWLGPAVLPDVSAYSPTRIAYDLDDVPEGYDTGNGAIDVLAPYRAGYHVTVGSGATVTLVGNLQDREGHPEKLLSGFAYPKQHPDHKLQIFTNSDGRFGAPGFAPGDWIVELGEPGPLQYQFSLPSDAAGIRDVGVLHPSQ